MSKHEITMMAPDRLIPYEKNAKIHTPAQVGKIVASIKKFGWRGNPIVVDKNLVIIAGHGRRLAALELALPEVPVIVAADLTEDEIKALRLADNRVAIADIDADLLRMELGEIEIDLDGIFDKKELDFVVADLGEINTSAFMVDLESEVAAQNAETSRKIGETDERPVKIDKALGFKSIQGRDERVVARFMAQIEAETGKVGAEAFVAFISSIMQPSAA